jgi:DedD protein
MADRIADNADLAVEELKRKARRRLVGAIVLALAAAVILPLLLEKEPRSLGDDVSVQIPPVDEGKFINRLTGRSSDTKSGAKSAARNEAAKPSTKSDTGKTEVKPAAVPATDVVPAPVPIAVPTESAPTPGVAASASAPANIPPPKKSVTEAEQRVLSPTTKPAARPDAKPVPETKTEPAATGMAAAPAIATTTVAPATAATVPTTKTEPVAPAAAGLAKPEGFAVQIAAFTDDKGANALAGKLKKAGYDATYTEPVETSRGTLWRVRVGGFAARADADVARVKLKADGWNGIVVAAK